MILVVVFLVLGHASDPYAVMTADQVKPQGICHLRSQERRSGASSSICHYDCEKGKISVLFSRTERCYQQRNAE